MRAIKIVRTSWIANAFSFIGKATILISVFALVVILLILGGELLVVLSGVGAAVGGIISGIMFLAWSEVIDILLDIRNEIVGENAKKQSTEGGPAMKITEKMFFNEFTHQGLKDRFSRSGLAALYKYLEEMNKLESCGVHELCRQYREYACLEDFCEEYKQEYNSLKDLEAKTNMTVIRLPDDGFIIRRH